MQTQLAVTIVRVIYMLTVVFLERVKLQDVPHTEQWSWVATRRSVNHGRGGDLGDSLLSGDNDAMLFIETGVLNAPEAVEMDAATRNRRETVTFKPSFGCG